MVSKEGDRGEGRGGRGRGTIAGQQLVHSSSPGSRGRAARAARAAKAAKAAWLGNLKLGYIHTEEYYAVSNQEGSRRASQACVGAVKSVI